MTRVIHTGDTHLGYRQYHSPERREDFLAAFRQVVEDAVAADVDAVVHAGDLYHDRRPGLGDLHGTIDVLRTLRDADVPFLGVVGNHEGTRDGQWLDLFETLGLATRLDDAGTVVGDTTFYGLDHVPQSRRDDLEYEFDPLETDHAALVSHGLFEPFAHANWDTETVLTESNVEFDALLLGDNHVPDRAEVAGTWVTYCGSTERTSASEREERGYNLVEFGDAAAASDASRPPDVSIRRRGLDVTRKFVFVDAELGPGEGPERVREQVRQHDLEDAVVIVTVEGDGDPVTPAELEAFASERGALVARVNDRREVDTDEEIEVSFADPDEVVRERVRDLGLSDAARDVDETVRDGSVADANVRARVEEHVRDRLDDEAAFATGADEGAETVEGGETVADADDAESATDSEPADDAAGSAGDAEPASDAESASDAEPVADAEPADDGQVSMEDYL